MKTLRKAPYEEYDIEFNFSADLQQGETISSYSVYCIDVDTEISTVNVIVDNTAISGQKIVVGLRNGALEENHIITAKIVTSANNFYEKEIVLSIGYDEQDSFEKQPREQFLISNDFSEDIKNNYIDSVTAIAERTSDEADLTSSVIATIIQQAKSVLLRVRSGDDGEYYRLIIRVADTAGNKYQKNIIMGVREI